VPLYAVIAVSVASLIIAIPALWARCGDFPWAFFAITGICTVGLYLAYTIPVYLRLAQGDASSGPWNLGPPVRWINSCAIVWVDPRRHLLTCPYGRPACRGSTSSTRPRSTTRRCVACSACSSGSGGRVREEQYTGPVRTLEEDEVTRGLTAERVTARPGARRQRRDAVPRGPARGSAGGTIDTIVTAFTDMQGRLFGKRIQVEYFLDDVVEHGVEGCNYLLALDMEMDPIPGYEMANWEDGYGDFAIVPDMGRCAGFPGSTARRSCSATSPTTTASPVVASPRQVLIAQYERAASMGYTPMFASELEFYLYKESYAEAHERDYRGLTPTIPYILDYHILATTMDETSSGRSGAGCRRAGIPVEFSKGEAGTASTRSTPLRGRGHRRRPSHDLQERRQGDRLPQRHLGELHGQAFGEGHRQLLPLHSEPRRRTTANPFVDENGEETDVIATSSGGCRARQGAGLSVAPSSTPTSATPPRAGRRPRSPGAATTAPAASGSVGHGQSRRVECRIPGADVNPYLGYARCSPPASTASSEDRPGPELKGNAYAEAEAEPFPSTLREAVDLWEGSDFARKTFGEASGALPELRPHRAAAVRRGRDRLRAPPHVRARY
jgi:glutamine synthetase